MLDIGWDEGILDDGRPYRAECWTEDGVTVLTFFFSREDLEEADRDELVRYLEQMRILKFLEPEAKRWVGASPVEDDDGIPIWSVNVVVGDETGTFVDDHTTLKPPLRRATEDTIREATARDLLRATSFAADRHRYQRRKDQGASAYINHPIAVAGILMDSGITDGVTLQAALLHDTIEDTNTKAAELERQFGPHVRDVVVELTDDKLKPKAMRKELQVLRTPHTSARARCIRIADKISNIGDVVNSPPSGWPLERRLDYLAWTRRVVDACRGVHSPLEARYDTVLKDGLERLRAAR